MAWQAKSEKVFWGARKYLSTIAVDGPWLRRCQQQSGQSDKMKTTDITARIASVKTRSAWADGVKTYALEMLEGLEGDCSEAALLNGARDWSGYSAGGCSLIYDSDIAERLCPPSELKRKRGGALPPNSRESWADCQARALRQAALMIKNAARA